MGHKILRVMIVFIVSDLILMKRDSMKGLFYLVLSIVKRSLFSIKKVKSRSDFHAHNSAHRIEWLEK